MVKMMRIIRRYTNLLMDQPVDETEDQFYDYIEADTRPMLMAQLHVTKLHYLYIMGRFREAVVEGKAASKIITFITQFKEEVGTSARMIYIYIKHTHTYTHTHTQVY
jgi:hypothetical protein